MNVHSSFICKSQNLESTQMSFNGEWLNCGIPRPGNTTRNEPLIHVTTWMNLKEIMLSEKANLNRIYIAWFHYVTFME